MFPAVSTESLSQQLSRRDLFGIFESFNGRLRDKLLNQEIFTTLTEAEVLIKSGEENTTGYEPYSSLGYRSPAPESIFTAATT